MPLEYLKIQNGRNLKEFVLEPHKNFNIIFGANGAGKTTILESIYLLLRARTFRSNKFKSFINFNENTCTIFSKFCTTDNRQFQESFTIGISRSKNSSQPILHLNSKKINKLSNITNLVVLGLITPESFNLLDSGPGIRRKFIDWGVFHVEHSFLSDWRSYKIVLSNRNKLLYSYSKNYKISKVITPKQKDLLHCWDHQLINFNNKLDNIRSKQIDNIENYFNKFLTQFSKKLADNISLKFYKGWSKEFSYKDYLQEKLNEDLFVGYTRYGTHRSDLKITINNNYAKDILSRGQKKTIVICLILAQFRFLIDNNSTYFHNILLLDDIDSELDSNNLQILFSILKTFNCQILATTTHEQRYDFLDESEHKMFHVEHD